jgi:hypothetical protein
MATGRPQATHTEHADLFALFDMDTASKAPAEQEAAPHPAVEDVETPPAEEAALAEAHPPKPLAPQETHQPAKAVLPEDWTVEDIRFLLEKLETGPLLVADTKLGIPTIHSHFGAEAEHCGFGLFKVKGAGFTLHFDAGGAMERTPSGKGWTRLQIDGDFTFDTGAVKAKLEEYLERTAPPYPAKEERDLQFTVETEGLADPEAPMVDQGEEPEKVEKQSEPVQENIPLKEQVEQFHRDMGHFTGTTQWTRYPSLCPHIVLLTDGVTYVAEHGGENGGTAYWLIDAIASYQGEELLKRHDFQFWKLIVHPPDLPEPEGSALPNPLTVGAALGSKQGEAGKEPVHGQRHASLICTNGNEKELVRQEIGYTDFLPAGEVKIYASIEAHPDISTQRKVMILLLPSEY